MAGVLLHRGHQPACQRPNGPATVSAAEMGTLLDEEPRSASLLAATDVSLLQLNREQFEQILAANPGTTRELFHVLCTRLREGLDIEMEAARREAARERELNLAAQIQQSLLHGSELSHEGITTAGYCRPEQTVGGDYYDYLLLGPDRIGLVITDVMGHGFASALLVSMVKSCFHTQIRHTGSVAAVFDATRQIVNRLQTGIYLSMCYTVVNTTTRVLTYANAGHPFPLHYHCHTGQIDAMESTCMPIGIAPDLPFPPKYVRRRAWDPGDVLLFFQMG